MWQTGHSARAFRYVSVCSWMVGSIVAIGCNDDAMQDFPLTTAGNGGGAGTDASVSGGSGGTGPTAGVGGSAGSVGPAPTEGLPCEVEAILAEKCQSCHGDPLDNGAFMPLLTWEDLHAPAPTDPSRTTYASVADRVHRQGLGAMPPDVRNALDEAELAVLDAWIAQGAPKVDRQACNQAPQQPPPQGGSGGTGGYVDDEFVDCVELRAHGQPVPNDTTPYNVASGERYVCFEFAAPWEDAVQAIRAESIIENSAVVHHWLLYEVNNPFTVDGAFSECIGTHPDASLLAGWAPGGGDLVMPENVGLKVPYGPEGRYRLELHYYNPGQATTDNSGVRLCATNRFREHEAGVTWLGTEQLGQFIPGLTGSNSNGLILAGQTTTFTGTCTPGREGLGPNDDIHILFSWPHMHKLGVHMNTTIIRANGMREVLHDGRFNFEYQVSYETPAVIRPGDRLETTCTFNNTGTRNVGFGTKTEDEMCYNFVWAYPAGALNRLGLSWVGAQNTCLL